MERLPDSNRLAAFLPPGERLLITGASGFIGQHLSLLLARHDGEIERWDLVARDRTILSCDLTDERETREQLNRFRPQTIFHLASSGVSHQRAHDHRVIALDIQMTANLIGALKDVPADPPPVLVIVGSMAEYAPQDRPLVESDPCYPLTAYGIAKHGAILYALAYSRPAGISLRIPRLFHIYGPGEAPGRLIPSLIDGLTRRQPVSLSGGEQRRDFIHVADVCEALVRIAGSQAAEGTIVNIGTGQAHSIRDVARWIAWQLEVDLDLLHFGEHEPSPGDADLLAADTTRIESLLEWVPPQRLLGSGSLHELFDLSRPE